MIDRERIVAICTPIYDQLSPHFWRALRLLWKPNGAPGAQISGQTHLFDVVGHLVEDARNDLTQGALEAEPRVEAVLFVDDDMTFPPHALKRLLDHDLPIVGGLCHNRRPPSYQPTLFRLMPESLGLKGRYGFCYHYPDDDLFEVDATGAGFVLIKREVFEAISAKFPEEKWWDRRGGSSEDISFMERARACGFKIHVDTGLKIGHMAHVEVDEAFARKNRSFEWASWRPDRAPTPGAPVASVVIPTFDQKPRHLRAAIASAAGQTVPVEVIVVDDGSREPIPVDGWPENVRVVRHDCNMGIAAALNTGISWMTTPWFCWLSSDDLLDPRKVERQLAVVEQGRFAASFHRWETILPEELFPRYGILPEWRNLEEQRAILGRYCAINGSTVMIARRIFDAVGRFDPSYRYGQDWEMWCRISAGGFFWHGIDEILCSRREHGNLTERIEADPVLLRVRDEEDARIRTRYGAEAPK